jgi:hypothetical protein
MAEQIITKRCTKCKVIKSLFEFHKSRREKDGHQTYCKSCQKEYLKNYQQTDKAKEAFRLYTRRYSQTKKGKRQRKQYRQSIIGEAIHKNYRESDRGKIKHLATINRYNIRHPERVNARIIVSKAIKKGVLPPVYSLRCACGKPAKHYHHPSYKPEYWLDVIPICLNCHFHLRGGLLQSVSAPSKPF